MALLSDFGASVYPGIVKGVILSLYPEAQVVDLTHNVAPYGVREGAWLLYTAYRYFPAETVFLAVVDPTVGSARQRLAVAAGCYYFVGPDNGLLYPAIWAAGLRATVILPRPPEASLTFEARDIFAPAAARLARGEPLTALGPPGEIKERLVFFREGREGEVVCVDSFGNIVTNLPPEPEAPRYRLTAGEIRLTLPFYATYAGAPLGEPFVITGSAGTLEISLREGNAATLLRLTPGTRLRLEDLP